MSLIYTTFLEKEKNGIGLLPQLILPFDGHVVNSDELKGEACVSFPDTINVEDLPFAGFEIKRCPPPEKTSEKIESVTSKSNKKETTHNEKHKKSQISEPKTSEKAAVRVPLPESDILYMITDPSIVIPTTAAYLLGAVIFAIIF